MISPNTPHYSCDSHCTCCFPSLDNSEGKVIQWRGNTWQKHIDPLTYSIQSLYRNHWESTTENLYQILFQAWEYIRQQGRKGNSICASYTLLSSHYAFEGTNMETSIHSRIAGSHLKQSQYSSDLVQIWKNKMKGLGQWGITKLWIIWLHWTT